ncbi:MAG TPA: hypothetical protein VFE51_25700 [Verrucomicrobiae bacterium]|nr:hypothetical protein [Verrucomicrobiae bacterium]
MKSVATLFCATLLVTTQSMCIAQPEGLSGPGKPVSTLGQAEPAALDNALGTYADLAGKTVLASSRLRLPRDLGLSGLSPDKATAIARIEGVLASNGITILQDGPHFVRVFSTAMGDPAEDPPLRGTEVSKLAGQETIPAGAISFPGTDLEQVLSIYAELRNRTILRPGPLPPLIVHLRTVCALGREEAVYALTTVLGLNGIVVVDDGEHFMQVVPKAQAGSVRAQAPKPRPDAPLFNPKDVPVVGLLRTYTPVPMDSRKFEADLAQVSRHCADRLVALYAEMSGKKAITSPDLGDRFVWFATQTPLSKEEVLYAIETTLILNKLAIINESDSVRLGKLSEPGR